MVNTELYALVYNWYIINGLQKYNEGTISEMEERLRMMKQFQASYFKQTNNENKRSSLLS